MNTGLYLPYLASQCLKYGTIIKRASLKHILDAKALHSSGHPADIIVNCTGLGAIELGGVVDKTVYPARGQIVIVRNDADAMYDVSGTDDGEDEIMYIMQRAAGGGTVLGGCYQKNNWAAESDPELSKRIMTRAVKACPALTGGKGIEELDIVRTAVGLRPLREDGTRLEAELIKEGAEQCWVVHSYGHGGFGCELRMLVTVMLIHRSNILRLRSGSTRTCREISSAVAA
jgi:D-amino-acid oxidase